MNGFQRREVARRLVVERFATVVNYLHPDRLAREMYPGDLAKVHADVERVAEGRNAALEEGDLYKILLLASLAYASVEIPTVDVNDVE